MHRQVAPGTGDLLTVNDLTVSYAGTHAPAVQGISFRVRDGERVGVVGESGSGKTTLALAVSDLLPRAAAIRRGSVILQGTDCSTLSARALRGIRGNVMGRVPQDPLAGLNPCAHNCATPFAHIGGSRRVRSARKL
jgi:peptide/nickel transport system ATP-binding protein